MSELQFPQEIAIVCDLSAIPAGEREEHTVSSQELFKSVAAVRELANGYAFRLPGESATLPKLAAFITNERLCCPFYTFGIEVEPQGGSIWLSLTGGDGVKQMLTAEIGSYLTEPVARAAGLPQIAR